MNALIHTANIIEDIRPYKLGYGCQVFYLWWASRYHNKWISLKDLMRNYHLSRRQAFRYIHALYEMDMIERKHTICAGNQQYRIK